MDEGISRLPERQLLEHRDFLGLEYPALYMCKPKRGVKRDESKETYKLPHRLIEKKRRDRINECIAQLKDLLPEHLKLTTLGHLEKAVVLELTLKHLKALTALTEQQHQKIVALQSGERSVKSPVQADLDAFHSGFQTCAKEVLQFLSRSESWTPREQRCAQLLGHLHAVSSQFLPGPRLLSPPPGPLAKGPSSSSSPPAPLRAPARKPEGQAHCVPVIQRTHAAEPGAETDTDTDSGYGGELEKSDSKPEQPYFPKDTELKYAVQERISSIKQESEDPPAKRSRLEVPDDDSPFGGEVMGTAGGFLPPHAHQPPLCLPFYLIPPSATAYLPMLEKCWYPASVPVLYPGLPAPAAALTSFVGPDKLSPPLLLPQRLPSPGPARSPIDSSALLQALKQIPPLNLETKD